MGHGVGGGSIAERARFNFGEDETPSANALRMRGAGDLLRNLSIAHCSNSSSLISAVGGVS